MLIHVCGSIAYDRIMDFPGRFEDHIISTEIHKLNVSFMVKEFRETFGGAAGNIAYNLSLLGERSVIYAAVGKDFSKYSERLKNFQIDQSGIKVYPQTLTASAYIITDKNDNQITGFFPGAMIFRSKKPFSGKNDLAIIAPGNPLEMLDLADYFYDKNIPYIFDPGQQIIQFTQSQLRKAIQQSTIYIVNDYELALTKKITGYDKNILLRAAKILVTTLGKKGSLIEVEKGNKFGKVIIQPVKTLSEKDPTGAGDAYRAGLIKGTVASGLKLIPDNFLKLPWFKIGQIAALAALYAVEEYGTQNHFYTFSQFKKRYQLTFRLKYAYI
jgi:adenosine kinase